MRQLCIASTLVSAVLLAGCPDPGGQYDAFLERTAGQRSTGAGGGPGGGTLADISGSFLLGLSSSSLPTKPLQFLAVNEFTSTTDGGTLTATFYPLKTWFNDSNRKPVGTPIEPATVDVDSDGAFVIDFGQVTMTGEANAISGSDLEATITLDAVIIDENIFCGDVTGNVTKPSPLDLTGSFFGAVRVSDSLDPPDDTLESQLGRLKYDNNTLIVCAVGETLAQIDTDSDGTPDTYYCFSCNEAGVSPAQSGTDWICSETGGDVPAVQNDTTLISCPAS